MASENQPYYLKLWQHIFYSMARGGGALVNGVLLQWTMYFYIPPADRGVLLMPIALFSGVMLFGRLVDAAADPLVGFWSDSTKSRWGRRIPFIALGAPVLIMAFILLWFPPVEGYSLWNGLYFALLASIFFFMYTVVFCPHNALLVEATDNTTERVAISGWGAFFMLAGAAIIAVVAAPIIDNYGYRVMAFIIGGIALFLLYGPVVAIKERKKAEIQSQAPPAKFTQSIKYALTNKPFVYYLMSNVCFQMGVNGIIIVAPYFTTQVLMLSEGYLGYIMGAHLASAFICFPFISKLSRHFGKAKLFSAGLLITALMLPLLYFVGKVELPLPLLVQGMIMFAIAGVPLSIIYVVPNAIVADTVDYDEAITGESRGAMYFGVQGVFHKTAVGLSSVLIGFLFIQFGNDASQPDGILLAGPVAGLLAFSAFLLFRRYPRHDYVEEARNKKNTNTEKGL